MLYGLGTENNADHGSESTAADTVGVLPREGDISTLRPGCTCWFCPCELVARTSGNYHPGI